MPSYEVWKTKRQEYGVEGRHRPALQHGMLSVNKHFCKKPSNLCVV